MLFICGLLFRQARSEPPAVAGHGLLLVSDIHCEHIDKVRPKQVADPSTYMLSFDKFAAVQ